MSTRPHHATPRQPSAEELHRLLRHGRRLRSQAFIALFQLPEPAACGTPAPASLLCCSA